MGKTEERCFKYVGYQITQEEDFSIRVDQSDFADNKIELIKGKPERAKEVGDKLTCEEETLVRKAAGKIGWLGRGTRPRILFAQVELSTRLDGVKSRI